MNDELTKHKNILLESVEEVAKNSDDLTAERDELREEVQKLR